MTWEVLRTRPMRKKSLANSGDRAPTTSPYTPPTTPHATAATAMRRKFLIVEVMRRV